MSQRSKAEIAEDLIAAGVDEEGANDMAGGHGLKGNEADAFLEDHDLENFEITPEQQYKLFLTTYDDIAKDCIRLVSKPDVIKAYGATDWDGLHPRIRDIVVDLRFRGDYTPTTRRRIQEHIARNELSTLALIMADEDYWVGQIGVPRDRYLRRKDYLQS